MTLLKPINIAEFYDWCTTANNGKPYSKETLGGIRTILRSSYDDAIENELCVKNPASRVPLPKLEKPKTKRAYSNEQIDAITEFAKSDSIFGHGILILLWTGIRSGELRALLWSDIDLNNNVIYINKAIKSDNEIGVTKNGESRAIPIRKDIADYLRDFPKNTRYVITTIDDNYVRRETIRHKLKYFFKRLNIHRKNQNLSEIPQYTPHEFRHSYTTWYMRRGANIEILQKITGHKDSDMTLHYTHYDVEDLRKIVDL